MSLSTNRAEVDAELGRDRILRRLAPSRRAEVTDALVRARIADQVLTRHRRQRERALVANPRLTDDIGAAERYARALRRWESSRNDTLEQFRSVLPVRLRQQAEEFVSAEPSQESQAEQLRLTPQTRALIFVEDVSTRVAERVLATDQLFQERCRDADATERVRVDNAFRDAQSARQSIATALRVFSGTNTTSLQREYDTFSASEDRLVSTILSICVDVPTPSWWTTIWSYLSSSFALGSLESLKQISNLSSWFQPDLVRETVYTLVKSIIDSLQSAYNWVIASLPSFSGIVSATEYVAYKLTEWKVVLFAMALVLGYVTTLWMAQNGAGFIIPLTYWSNVLCELRTPIRVIALTALAARYLSGLGASRSSLLRMIVTTPPRFMLLTSTYCWLFTWIRRRLFPDNYPLGLTAGALSLIIDPVVFAIRPFVPTSFIEQLELPYLDEIDTSGTALTESQSATLRQITSGLTGTELVPSNVLQQYVAREGIDVALALPDDTPADVSSLLSPEAIVPRNTPSILRLVLRLNQTSAYQVAAETIVDVVTFGASQNIRAAAAGARQVIDRALNLSEFDPLTKLTLGILVGLVAGPGTVAGIGLVTLLRATSDIDATPLGPVTTLLEASPDLLASPSGGALLLYEHAAAASGTRTKIAPS